MNLKYLINYFLLENEGQLSKSYDPVSDFEVLLNSPLPCKYVIENLETRILPKIKEIHENHVIINVKIHRYWISILKDDKLLHRSARDFFGDDIEKIIKEEISSHLKNCNVIINFECHESAENFIISNLTEIIKSVVESIFIEIIVVKINKDDMFKFCKRSYPTIFQYFYKRNEEYFCAYIKNDFYSLKNYDDIPILHFMVERFTWKNTLRKSFRELNEFSGGSQDNLVIHEYISYVVEKIFEMCDTLTYFENYFLRADTNNFLGCYDLFKSRKEYKHILKSYLNFISDERKIRLVSISNFFCLCCTEDSDRYSLCHKKNSSFKNIGVCQTINEFMDYEDIKEIVLESVSMELQSFFAFVFKNNLEVIMKDKKKYVKIMSVNIISTFEKLLEKLRKRILFIMSYYNIRKEEIEGEYHKEVTEMLKKELSSNDITIIDDSLKK